MQNSTRFRHQDIVARRRANLSTLLVGHQADQQKLPDRARRIHVNEGSTDPSLLLVVFTGLAGQSNRRYAFEQLTGRMGCSRVLLYDADHLCYLRGIRPAIEGYEALRDRVVRLIEAMSPQRVIFAGECLGGFAAIRMGCELNVEAVHAFGAVTLCSVPKMIMQRQWEWLRLFRMQLARIYRHGYAQHANFDLRRVIERSAGNTRYFVHVSRDNASDMRAAMHLSGMPRASLIRHRGETHIPAFHLEGHRTLDRWLTMHRDALDFSNTPTEDDDLELLGELKELAFLDLSNTQVTDAGLKHLAGLPLLKYVDISHTGVTDSGTKAFTATRPGVQFERSSPILA